MIWSIWRTFPYSHAFWSTVISVITGFVVHYLTDLPLDTWWLWIWGGVFYGVREVIQWRQKGNWDMKGFVWGAASPAVMTLIAST
ncbi:hypothetical protein [Shimia sediminis]|uniref:hypothetical protein n=1 Tax=Shimia sediminis TaxID=2497945 RepID=UPI000F8D1D31|nr:hypothetical protein [Shimia sediminis]